MANDINRSVKIYIDSTEAGKSIEGLESQIKKLEAELNGLNAADPKQAAQAEKLKKQIESSNKTLIKYKVSVAETDRVLKNLSGSTYKELLAVKQRISAELAKTNRGTTEYNMKLKHLKAVSKEVAFAQKEMRTEIGCQASAWGRGADFVNRYMGLIGSSVAAVTGITMAFSKFRDERDKLESSSANLKALTGLGDEDVKQLENAAKRLSTTVTAEGVRIKQSATEIDDSFAIIGSQRPELLKNAEALEKVTQDAIYLSIAGKDKLEPAAKALTTVMNQMNLSASESRRIINAIAAGSQAGAGSIQYITDAFEKSGTTANLMNVSLEQLIGTVEAVAPKYSEAAVAGNSLDKVLLKMKEKQIGYKDGLFDLNAAIDELSARFKKGESAAQIFGMEHAKMAEILVMNKEDINKYTEAVTGSNKAVEQAQINSSTNEAKRAQARNKMTLLGIELIEKLNPAITGAMDLTVNWTDKIVKLADWVSKNTFAVASAAIGLGVYTAAVKLNSYWKTVSSGTTMKAIATEKLHAITVRTSIAAEYAQAAATAIVAGKFKLAAAASKSFLISLGLNPLTAAVVAITALAVGIYKVWDNTTKTSRALKSMNAEVAKEQASAYSLFDALKRSNEGTEQRRTLINEINSKYGQYLDNQLTEKSTTGEIADALQRVNEKLQENIVLKKMQEEKEAVLIDIFEKQKGYMDDMRESSKLGDTITSMMLKDVKRITDEGLKYGQTWQQSYSDVISYIDSYYGARGNVDKSFWEGLEGYIKRTYTMAQKMDAITKTYTPFLPVSGENELPETIITADKTTPTTTAETKEEADAKKQKEILDRKLKVVDDYVLQERLKYQNSYLQGLTDKEEYNRKLELLELEALNRRLSIYNLDKDKQAEIQDKIQQYKIKILEQNAKFEESQEKYRKKAEEKAAKAKEKNLTDELHRQLKIANDKKQEEEATELSHRQKMVELAQGFSTEIGNIVGGAIAGNSDIVKSSLVSIINMGLDALKIQCQMAVAGATMQSLAQADSIATFGAAGFARALVLTGLIEAAFGAVKAVVGSLVNNIGGSNSRSSTSESSSNSGKRVVDGFAVGGYTGDGDPTKVVGPAHFDEYVVPSFVLHRPDAMNHVAALEALRQQRTSYNTTPLPTTGYANGGFTPQSGIDNFAMKKTIEELSIAVRSLSRLDLKAYVVYSDLEKKKKTLDKARKVGGK